MGMVLLAGLAYYQGGMAPAVDEQEVLAGTIISETPEQAYAENTLDSVENDCVASVGAEQSDSENCPDNNH